ncbi:MAG: hypothetical protein Q9216_005108 [Gyalolechia sp. 2 TL-2023]
MKNTLFLFNAYDHQQGGIRHSFALTACGIIAGNIWDGYLSREISGPSVTEGIDEVLIGRNLYYHNHPYSPNCTCTSRPYPVYAEFGSWPFPHGKTPPWWPSIPLRAIPKVRISDISMAVKARDETCRITGSAEAGETAHIIAVRENEWFEEHGMYNYSADLGSINSSSNQLLLRADLHITHENFQWVFFPNGQEWVYYAIDDSVELASLYHQRKVRALNGVKPEYLLAAFARAIFPRLGVFLKSPVDKYLLGVDVGNGNPVAGVKKDAAWCADRFRLPGRPRTPSPTKRKSPSKGDGGNPRKRVCDAFEFPESTGEDQQLTKNDNDFSDASAAPENKRFRYRNPQRDGPCICPALPPSPSLSSSSDKPPRTYIPPAQPTTICMSDQCPARAERDRLERLRQETLKRERLTSDPEGTWEQHLEWAENDPTATRHPRRWFWVHGEEVWDDDGEEIVDFGAEL